MDLSYIKAAQQAAGKGPPLILSALNSSGSYRVDGERYKRVPQGQEADHPRAELLQYKGLHAEAVDLDPDATHSADFTDICLEHCRQMLPLHSWLAATGERAVL